jgi:DNA-binding SARP family transcriptional activator/predicted ATPase
MAAVLTLAFLGSFEAARQGIPVTHFESDKVRALLAYLVAERQRTHRRDALAALLWPESPPERARRNLNQALSNLRLAIGDREPANSLIVADRNSVALQHDGALWADLIQFEDLLEACRTHQHHNAATCAECMAWRAEAAALYKGDFLKGFVIDASSEFDDWLLMLQGSLHRRALEAMSALADYHEARWELPVAMFYAERQVELEPWHEAAHLQLMRLMARSGQHAAALQQYARLETLLAEEFGVPPAEETQQLAERIRAAEKRAARRALPALATSFLGRESELAELTLRLAQPECRLLTIVGPGGVGKTRLAIELARRMENFFLEGIYFVALAALPASTSLPGALADVLGITLRGGEPPMNVLKSNLREKEILLILDGFEHFSGSAQLVTEMLQDAPQLKVLATSRVRMQTPDENVHFLLGLSVPPLGAQPSRERHDAVRLFVERGRQSDNAFTLDSLNAGHIGRICRLVGGLPLALELAAAWVRALSCQEIADEIQAGLNILSLPGQPASPQHNLRAVFDRSWQMLSPAGQEGFSRLSLFAGGFSRRAAAEVAGLSLDALATLVDHSLIRLTAEGRYGMHELLQQYGAEKLAAAAADEMKALEQRFIDYFLRLAEAHRDEYRLLAQESANILVAMARASGRQMWQANITFASILAEAWFIRARLSDARQGYRWASEAAERLGDQAVLAGILRQWARACIEQADYEEAEEKLELSQRLCRDIDDTAGYAEALHHRGRIAMERFHFERAARLLRKSLRLFRECGRQAGAAQTLYLLADIPYYRQEYGRTAELVQEALAIQEEIGDRLGAIRSLELLAMTALKQLDYRAGQDHCLRALVLCEEVGDRAERAAVFYILAEALRNQGELAGAEERARESLRLAAEMGDRKLEARALWRLSLIQADGGNNERALANCRRSNNLFVQMQDDWSRCYVLRFLGDIYQAMGRDVQARQTWLEALDLGLGDQHPEYETIRRRLGRS